MAVTLNDVKMNTQDALSQQVIDEFCKSSFLMDNLIFDDVVSPSGGGAAMTYAYTRVLQDAQAAARALNSEYEADEAKKERHTVDLKVLGSAFEIDRVLAATGGIVDEVQFQLQQKIKAVQALFSDMVINGDTEENANAFEGLDKALADSATEMDCGGIDLSTSALVTANYMQFLDAIEDMLSQMDGAPTCLLGNTKMMTKLRACARRAAMYQTTKDDWGQTIEYYGSIPLVDLGAKAGSEEPIIGTDAGGLTSLYAVRIGLDGFHGVSMNGQSPIKSYLPDFNTAGVVKRGEVEMVAAVALKNSKAAAVMRGVKVQ